MEKTYHGQCLCSAVRFEINATFSNFYLCHCTRCQKDTGSAHAANLFAMGGDVKWHAGKDKAKIFRLPNTQHQKSFCEDCGAALPNLQMEGKLLVVPAGSLDDPVQIRPDAHICCNDRANWDEELNLIPNLPGLPG
jgi:hypothetical protein